MIIEGADLSLDAVESGEHYKNCRFSYSHEPLRFSDVIFERCEFQQINFDDSEWLDCQFIHLNFSNYSFNNSS